MPCPILTAIQGYTDSLDPIFIKYKAMSKQGLIVLVEDDTDDMEIFAEVIKDLHVDNEIIWLPNTESAFTFLQTNENNVFIIFCDINLPGKNGLEFKRDIDNDPELRKKSIPFVFYSTAAKQDDVNEAYTQMTVQGFFKKESTYSGMKSLMKIIFDYWEHCKHPNAA
jgi:CheY-like chemotaxis protein